ncbi:hypothetical protein ACHHYP_07272 [Achlya hypogyna]|uniref:Uncharacterized protein n=1 Tax=Achlya hypogyna TaxID=1202772 RepID=A0A1V9YQY9_ACHHY|nr:hypothetical protein ACHHYP_07272 [Achlya hypogyna]
MHVSTLYHLSVASALVASLQVQCLYVGVCPGTAGHLLYSAAFPSAIFAFSFTMAGLMGLLALLPSRGAALLHPVVSAVAIAGHFVIACMSFSVIANVEETSAFVWTTGNPALQAYYRSSASLASAMRSANGAVGGIHLCLVGLESLSVGIYVAQLCTYCGSKCASWV